MRKIPFKTIFVFFFVFLGCILQSTPVEAVRCTYGTCELISTFEDVNPMCVKNHLGQAMTICNYDLEYYACDGPDCIDGTVVVTENPCKIDGLCYPVHAIDYCDSEKWVTTSYKKAVVYTPWLCPMNDCFYGNCDYNFPECSIGRDWCPNS